MNSLMDFGEIGRLALGVQQLQAQQRHNELVQSQQDLEDRRMQMASAQNAQQQKQQLGMNLYKLTQDPVIMRTPGAKEQLWTQLGQIYGAPAINAGNIKVGEQTYRDYFEGMASGDPNRTMDGAVGIALSSSPDDAKKLFDGFTGIQKRQEEIKKIQQYVEANAGKVEALQNNNAMVNIAKPQYEAFSSLFRDDLRGTDSPQFKQLVAINSKNPSDALLSSKNPLIQDKSAFAQILDGNFGNRALKFNELATGLSAQVNQDQKLLTDSEHGIALPQDVTPAMLRARIETNGTLLGAARSMQAWYENPLDQNKLMAAKAAYKTVESRRIDMENLAKSTNADRVKMQQDALTFRMDESQRKQAQADQLSEAQRQFYALPDNQQTKQAASKISRSLKESSGIDVSPEDIYKNPNKPLVENVTKVNMAQEGEEAKKVGGGFGEQYIDLQKADIASRAKLSKYDRMDQLLSGMQTGKLVPAMTNVQSIADSLGLSVDKTLPAKQAFQALSGEIALSLRNPSGGAGMPGALSDRDLTFLQSMTPDLAKTTDGNKLIIDTARKLAKRDQDIARMAREYRKKNGQFDEGFFDQLATYSEKNQLFPHAGKSAQPQASATIPTIKGDAEFSRLPSGAVFIGPDGKRRRKP